MEAQTVLSIAWSDPYRIARKARLWILFFWPEKCSQFRLYLCCLLLIATQPVHCRYPWSLLEIKARSTVTLRFLVFCCFTDKASAKRERGRRCRCYERCNLEEMKLSNISCSHACVSLIILWLGLKSSRLGFIKCLFCERILSRLVTSRTKHTPPLRTGALSDSCQLSYPPTLQKERDLKIVT